MFPIKRKFFAQTLKHRLLIFGLGCLLSGVSVVFATEAIPWEKDFSKALLTARESGRHVFVHFYGDHCPPCRVMDRQVFPRQDVAAAINRSFVAVKVDSTQNTELAKKMGVTAIPCDVVLTSTGQFVDRRDGGISAERFMEYVNLMAANLNRAVPQRNSIADVAPSKPSPGPVATTASSTLFTTPVIAQSTPAATPPPSVPSPPPSPSISADFASMPYLSRPSDSIPSKETTIPSASTLNTSSEAETASIAPATGSDALEAAAIARQPLRSEPATNPVIPETAVSPSQGATTVEIPLGLEGYCPVELSRTERWIPGNPLYYAMYRGQIFRFSTEEALEQFQREPARYAPIAGGDDIVLMVDRNKKVAGQRKFGVWYKDRVYLFSSGVSFEAFSVKPDYYSEIAEKYETALRTHFDKVQR